MAAKSHGKLHVFAGTFASREEACLYTEEQWEPEPDDSVSDEETQLGRTATRFGDSATTLVTFTLTQTLSKP